MSFFSRKKAKALVVSLVSPARRKEKGIVTIVIVNRMGIFDINKQLIEEGQQVVDREFVVEGLFGPTTFNDALC